MAATKEQEMKALEQIRKIVASLGEDSYIGMAFEGCFEDAEDNIRNDWAMSMNGRWQDAEQKVKKYEAKIERLYAEDEAKAEEIKRLQEEIYCLKNTVSDLTKQRAEAKREAIKARKDVTVNGVCKPFAEVRFYNNDGFRFINVVQESGWTTSYKIEDLKELVIR